jgi:hypothetical protein
MLSLTQAYFFVNGFLKNTTPKKLMAQRVAIFRIPSFLSLHPEVRILKAGKNFSLPIFWMRRAISVSSKWTFAYIEIRI